MPTVDSDVHALRRPRSFVCPFAILPAVILIAAGFAAAADEPPSPAPAPQNVPAGTAGEVVVEAPEPKYVAPTRRDRIGRIWAPVLINDQGPFRLVLDTGASHSAVTPAVAAALGLPPAADHSMMLHGVTGSRSVPSISVDSIVVGDLELRGRRLPVITDALGGAEGVLGTEGLQDKRIFIDFRHDRIKISRSHGERPEPGFVTIPVKIVGGLLLLADVRIGPVKAKAIIDTGGQGTIANQALEDLLYTRIRAEDIRADEITGATLDVQRGDRVNTPLITLGGITIRGMHITAGDLVIFQHWKMNKEPALLIGMDVLGLLDTLIIDYTRKELQIRMRDG